MNKRAQLNVWEAANFEDNLELSGVVYVLAMYSESSSLLCWKLEGQFGLMSIVASSFAGSYVTHETKHFVYFYIGRCFHLLVCVPWGRASCQSCFTVFSFSHSMSRFVYHLLCGRESKKFWHRKVCLLSDALFLLLETACTSGFSARITSTAVAAFLAVEFYFGCSCSLGNMLLISSQHGALYCWFSGCAKKPTQ